MAGLGLKFLQSKFSGTKEQEKENSWFVTVLFRTQSWSIL
jgi:hypothetical protein